MSFSYIVAYNDIISVAVQLHSIIVIYSYFIITYIYTYFSWQRSDLYPYDMDHRWIITTECTTCEVGVHLREFQCYFQLTCYKFI